nr:MAG TPA: hypothetical protein [Caudoviricetes sp.]
MSTLWQTANISGGWNLTGSCCWKVGPAMA